MFCIQINKRGYRTNEPNEREREESIVWKKVLGELWKERFTIKHIASELHIPCSEIESLIFGLTHNNIAQNIQSKREHLKVVE